MTAVLNNGCDFLLLYILTVVKQGGQVKYRDYVVGILQISVQWQYQGVLECVRGPLNLNKANTMRSNNCA